MTRERRFAALCAALQRGAFGTGPPPPLDEQAPLLALAEEHGVAGIAARGLEAPGAPSGAGLAAGMSLEVVYRRAARALEGEGVPFVLWKGLLADAAFYGARGARRATDIDLIIESADDVRAVSVLERAGLQVVSRTGKATVLQPESAPIVLVDLHRTPLNTPPFQATSAEVLRHRRFVETPIGVLPAPRPEHLLALIAGNLAGGLLVGQVRLCLDAAAVLRHQTIDAAFLIDVAKRWRVVPALWGVLRFAEARFGASPPLDVMHHLAPRRALAGHIERLFGVRGPPRVPRSRFAALVLVDWPLADRPTWIVEKVARAGARRVWNRRRRRRPR